MKAFILETPGGVENLKLIDLQKPQIESNKVLIKIQAISINPVDVKSRAVPELFNWVTNGKTPFVSGWDVSGIVEEVGRNVSEFKVGDKVFGMLNFLKEGGAYAEYILASPNELALKPKTISHIEASTATIAAQTAWQVLVNVANVQKGDKVLIHAAAGGVGHFAVQFAKYFGAYVVGVASANNKDYVLSIGADEHIDYKSQQFENKSRDFDLVFDTIGGDTLTRSFKVVKQSGRVVTITSSDLLNTDVDLAKSKNVKFEHMLVQSSGKDAATIINLMDKGVVKVNIHKIFTFDDLAKAHLEVETGHVRGKVVVTL